MSTIDKISTLLKENKKKQKDLMDYLGLEKSTFSAWKANKNTSYKQYISDIAEYFNVSTDYLLGFTDDPIDYENTDEVQNAPADVIDELKDPKKIYDFMRAQKRDAEERDNPEKKSVSSLNEESEDKAFFRLRKGLEPYNLSESDTDFLLSVFKAHKESNK